MHAEILSDQSYDEDGTAHILLRLQVGTDAETGGAIWENLEVEAETAVLASLTDAQRRVVIAAAALVKLTPPARTAFTLVSGSITI